MRWLRELSFAGVGIGLGIVACGTDDPSNFDGGNKDGGIGFLDGQGLGCNPPCGAGMICSSKSHCIPQGTCEGDSDCGEGMVCDTEAGPGKCVPGSGCGSTSIGATLQDPNMLVVLDRSCSMTEKVGTKTKWEIAVGAVNTMTTNFSGKIRFGLTMFPDTVGTNCTQGTIPIPVAPSNESKIQSTLTSSLVSTDPNFPDGPCVTNIDTAMQQAQTEPAFKDGTRASFALLLTDGAQAGCSAGGGNAGTLKAVTDLNTAGVKTFVVGFGGAVDTASLNSFAKAGGVPATGVNQYYDAADQKSLDNALATIGSQTLGCTFKLASVPPDPTKVFVFFEKSLKVPFDATKISGWDYDAVNNVITIYGAFCDDLKTGKVKVVDVVYGCPNPKPN